MHTGLGLGFIGLRASRAYIVFPVLAEVIELGLRAFGASFRV